MAKTSSVTLLYYIDMALNALYYIAISLIIQPETTAIIILHLTLSIICTYTDFLNYNPVTLRQYMKLYITYNLNQLQECNIYLSYPVYPITFTRIYNSISYIFHSRVRLFHIHIGHYLLLPGTPLTFISQHLILQHRHSDRFPSVLNELLTTTCTH